MMILKVMCTWKHALISAPIAVTFMVHCKNAEVQLQLGKLEGLKLFDEKVQETNKQVVCCIWIFRESLTKFLVNAS